MRRISTEAQQYVSTSMYARSDISQCLVIHVGTLHAVNTGHKEHALIFGSTCFRKVYTKPSFYMFRAKMKLNTCRISKIYGPSTQLCIFPELPANLAPL